MKLDRAVGKIENLESFKAGKFEMTFKRIKLETSSRSWKGVCSWKMTIAVVKF